MNAIRACQLNTGLGAGNIGDELMAQVFWRLLPPDVILDVAVFAESARQRDPYPRHHAYRPVDTETNECACLPDMPGLLVGGTPVTDAEGVHWPMRFLSRRLQHVHAAGQPVDAVGVGVDRWLGAEAERLFSEEFLTIRSWTVRSESCKQALLAHGVAASRIQVGADFAWLHPPRPDLRDWARSLWRRWGIDPDSPLLVVNTVNMAWQHRVDLKRNLAEALDCISRKLCMQIAFLCNECRHGEFFDHAAALEVVAFMSRPAVVMPNDFYAPAEVIALLESATLSLGQRYHFVIQSVLAGCAPIASLRGEKMRALVAELSIPSVGPVEALDSDDVASTVDAVAAARADLLGRLAGARDRLATRALNNLAFLRALPPYADARWSQAGRYR